MLRRLLVASSCAVLTIALAAMSVLAQAPAAQDGFMHVRSGRPDARLCGSGGLCVYSGRPVFFFFLLCLRKLTPISSPLTQASSQRR